MMINSLINKLIFNDMTINSLINKLYTLIVKVHYLIFIHA